MILDLLDWRRRVSALYASVRAERTPHVAHAGWVTVREALYAEHPCSPVDRLLFQGLEVAPYDPAYRVVARLEPAPPHRLQLPTGRRPAFERIGRLRTPFGSLDAWWLDGYGGGLWVPVRDASESDGRWLLDTARGADLGADADGRLVLDLNFLFVPPGSGVPAPPGNAVEVSLPVGDQGRDLL